MSNEEPPTQRIVFWASMAVGAAIVVFAIQGLRSERLIDLPRLEGGFELGTFVKFFVGGALLVDFVVIPLGALIGWLLKKVVPSVVWGPVRAGLFVTGVLAVYAYSLLWNKGGNPGNETLRTRNYTAGFTWFMVATWVIVAAFAAAAVLRERQAATTIADD